MDENISVDSTEVSWTDDIEEVLRNVNENSDYLQEEHRRQYLYLKCQLYYYRIPIILFSSVNSVFSVGLSAYVSQKTTSLVNCMISLLCACISAIELFVGIHKGMENSLAAYHGYKLLTIKISACLKLTRKNRELEGVPFLKEVLSDYNNLLETSMVISPYLDDILVRVGDMANPIRHRTFSID
jgi:hypothetical protein